MASIYQIKTGVGRYVEQEILPALPGWRRWVFGAGAVLAVGNAEKIVQTLSGNEMVRMIGLVREDGEVDIDTAYKAIRTQAEQTGPTEIDVPAIGKLRMSADDIDKLYRYIKEA